MRKHLLSFFLLVIKLVTTWATPSQAFPQGEVLPTRPPSVAHVVIFVPSPAKAGLGTK